MLQKQPLSLFSYLFDYLVLRHNQTDEGLELSLIYPLEIDERIIWLQKAQACIEECSPMQRQLSYDLEAKRTQVSETLSYLHHQKLIFEKLNKKQKSNKKADP